MNTKLIYQIVFISFAYLLCFPHPSNAEKAGKFVENASECLDCHADAEVKKEAKKPRAALFVPENRYKKSAHAELNCIECHLDADVEDADHQPDLKPARCDSCHRGIVRAYKSGSHRKARAEGNFKAPKCSDCHGSPHQLKTSSHSSSPVNIRNIPALCGNCHREGEEKASFKKLEAREVRENFSMQLHGKGIFDKGLKTSANCANCHNAHQVLPSSDKKSSVARSRVTNTCTQCHNRIEDIHKSSKNSKAWKRYGASRPVCTDCHQPHEHAVDFEKNVAGFSDASCMNCHKEQNLHSAGDSTKRLFVNATTLQGSAHSRLSCVKCHTDVDVSRDPVCKNSTPVSCASCHSAVDQDYMSGIHGKLHAKDDEDAPNCIDCHGKHGIQNTENRLSSTHRSNIPKLCATCHRKGEVAAKRLKDSVDVVRQYEMSIHGRALEKSGLLVTAVCTDCHSAHRQLPPEDSLSTVHHDQVAETCSSCHEGILEKFSTSIHSPEISTTSPDSLPSCSDCHFSHDIRRIDEKVFRKNLVQTCGNCHEDVSKTYYETFHGKGTLLGNTDIAKCSDCHGSHSILPADDTLSTIHPNNRTETCASCHPGSNAGFSSYLTHASHNDREKYPQLFYTFWGMTGLLVGTFAFFGLHTLLWFLRSLIETLANRNKKRVYTGKWVRRFPPIFCIFHLSIIISFLGLALTGMTLKFSHEPWAFTLSQLLGGVESSAFIHRVCAVITFGYFGGHIIELIIRKRRDSIPLINFFWGESSMFPGLQDLKDFIATARWFVFAGPKPKFGRWTYWEKFDYMAVFWGVAIIGSTGLILWLPEFFTLWLPGWIINVATIIHSDEALLATGFIFTIHFFNTHFRPDKFPMDTVIFTGKIPLEIFEEERPREYEKAVRENRLESMMTEAPAKSFLLLARSFGFAALFTGVSLVTLIIWALIP